MTRARRVLVLCVFPPGFSPGQRFRVEQYLPVLREAGIEVTQASFWDDEVCSVLYETGHTMAKLLGVVRGFRRRLRDLMRVRKYDYVLIHLEAAPVGPPLIEAMVMLLGKPIVYDIDDAMFMAATSKANRLVAPFRWRSKTAFVTKHAYKVTAVNPFMMQWASKYNSRVQVVPTVIDPDYHRPPARKARHQRPILGWTGARSTAPYLDVIRPVLLKLQETHDFELRVICDIDPKFPDLKHYTFVKWRQETEIEDLQSFDIGLMPVEDTVWARGKVGFKAIQYSAIGVPPVASDVGSGREVVEHNNTGLLVANTDDEWLGALKLLIDNEDERVRMGRAARERILARYAVPVYAQMYIDLFS